MRKFLFLLILSLLPGASLFGQVSRDGERPALVLAIVVDQMRYDYLPRFAGEFEGGLARLLEEGASFANAHYGAAPTVTAVGHSTILSGATPALSGIIGNTWFDRETGGNVESITDGAALALGGGDGASPRRLMVSTVGDELKNYGAGSKVFGVSLKDRSAILPAGRDADGAFWLENGRFVSSDWYFPALPAWAQRFNAEGRADAYAGRTWLEREMPAEPGAALYRALDSSPFADDLVLEFALALMDEEDLGGDEATDLLAVSFSATDYVGHGSGPDTPYMRDMILNVDRLVGRLLEAAEARAGEGEVLVVFTADHGVAPVPEENAARGLPGGRYDARAEREALEQGLRAEFGAGEYVLGSDVMGYYLNPEPVRGRRIDRNALQEAAAALLRRQPHVLRVYTQADLAAGFDGDLIDRRVKLGFHPQRSPDVLLVHEPNWLAGYGGPGGGTTHGSPFSYDTHVPVIFWGPSNLVKPGLYHGEAAVHDIAPTLSAMLGIAQPSGSIGRVLQEVLP